MQKYVEINYMPSCEAFPINFRKALYKNRSTSSMTVKALPPINSPRNPPMSPVTDQTKTDNNVSQ